MEEFHKWESLEKKLLHVQVTSTVKQGNLFTNLVARLNESRRYTKKKRLFRSVVLQIFV